MINLDVDANNWLIKAYAIKDLFEILVTVSVNVINTVILVSIYSIKFVSVKKKLVNKLVGRSSAEECIENIEETRLVETTSSKNENKLKFSSCTLYIVLFSIFFTINVGIGTYFAYSCWYFKNDVIGVNNLMKL